MNAERWLPRLVMSIAALGMCLCGAACVQSDFDDSPSQDADQPADNDDDPADDDSTAGALQELIGDPDRDGIDSRVELEMGFDPFDPASAPAWHPEYDQRPRLLFDSGGLEQMLIRAQSDQWPYNKIVRGLRSRSQRTIPQMPTAYYDPTVTLQQSDIAQAAAFVSILDNDRSLCSKALQILASIEHRVHELPLNKLDENTILGGTALGQFSVAYDLLASIRGLDPVALENARLGVVALADALYHFQVEFLPIELMLTQNNHNIKFAAGLGMAGLCFNMRPEAAVYVSFAQTEIYHYMLDWQYVEGGGWAEGPNYLSYTEESSLPYLAAYNRFAQGENYPYTVDCRVRFGGCEGGVLQINDMLLDPRLEQIHRWWLDIALPWGQGPMIDDSNLHDAYSGIWAALTHDPEYYWNFQQRGMTGRLDLMHLAFYQENPSIGVPSRPRLKLLEPAGQGVLRSSASPDALYALLLGEHGVAREHGIGHEHPDATSFSVAAFGRMLLIDSGYINFEKRGLVADAENHNLILVDGKGPPSGLRGLGCGVDAYLSTDVDLDNLSGLKVEARYAGVDFERRLLLVRDNYLVVIDRTADDADHEYSSLWHTLSSGTIGGNLQIEGSGFRFEADDVGLEAWISSTDRQSLDSLWDYHGQYHSIVDSHQVVSSTVSALNPAWATVLIPYRLGDVLPQLAELEAEGLAGWIVEDDQHLDVFAVSQAGDDSFCITLPLQSASQEICTDSGIVIYGLDKPALSAAWDLPQFGISSRTVPAILKD
ncbi:MAG: heparinase II/III family protein [Candidatus Alcyoniella australis]|nr:heparinase II/III family protein [Candidatus Alcyoniella australis]